MCDQWAACTRCENLSNCQGNFDDPVVAAVVPLNDQYNCFSGSECAKNRCLCNLDLITKLARAIIDEGPLVDDNKNIEQAKCHGVSAPGSSSEVACCGDAPAWRPYNIQRKNCVGGILQDIGA